jgi:plastocyanin
MKNINFFSAILMLSLLMISGIDSYATRYSIDVRDFEFSPSDLPSIKIGDTIHWEWKSGSHTTTSTTIPSGATPWDNPMDATHLTFNYVPTKAGVYHYKCSVHGSMAGQFTVVSELGIVQNTQVPKITIYPNPASDKIFVDFTPQEGIFIQRLAIYDMGGKIIREASFNDRSTFPEYIDLTGIPEGMMVFEFVDNLNRTYIRKALGTR